MSKIAGKPKLLRMENKYQKLHYRLNTFGSARIKLEYLMIFLYELAREKEKHLYFSYFDELLQNYIELITAPNLEYHPIDILISLKLIEETFLNQNIKETKSADFINTQKILSNQLALTYIYLGQWYKALRVFFPNLTQNDFSKVSLDLTQELSNTSESTILQKYIRIIGKDTLKDIKTILNTLKSWEDVSTKTSNDKIWVLLIEHESQDVFGNQKKDEDIVAIGNIHQLNTESHSLPSDSAQDFVLFNNLSLSYNDLLYQQANSAIKVAKKYLGKCLSKSNDHYNVIHSFLDKKSYYSGESLGLAMSLSTLSSISRNNDYKKKYSLLQDYCITGSITHDGTINPISSQTLTTKLNAVYYSPFKKVLISESNKIQALAELNKFKEDYPQRDLEIITANNIKDAALNQNILSEEITSFKQRLKQKSNKSYIIPILILLLLIPIYYFFIATTDQNPANLKFDGSKIEVYNNAEKFLWDYDFGFEFEKKLYDIQKGRQRSRFIFKDINNDGYNELIFSTQNNGDVNGTIYLFNSDGNLNWYFNDHPKIKFGDEVIDNIYNAVSVYVNEFNGEQIIFGLFHEHILYPAHFMAFDINGNIIGDYWNSGHFNSVIFADVDNDKVDEIILGGCNNGYNKGIICVLEHDRIIGHSPQLKDAYTPKTIPKGEEKYYIKFPDPKELLFARRGEIIEMFSLSNGTLRIGEYLGLDPSSKVYYTFTNEFKIIDFGVNDSFIANYNEKFNRNIFEDYPMEILYEKLSKLEYWNGEEFVSKPVMSN